MKTGNLAAVSLLIVALAVACGPQPQTTPVVSVESAPAEGQAGLIDELRAAGAQIEPGDPVEQPFFSVGGQILKVNGQDVQVFEYDSPESMEAEAAQVSADGGSVGTSMISWMATPHFFKSGRLLVLYVGDDAALLEMLKDALGAQFAGG